jgi:hypothetical protein
METQKRGIDEEERSVERRVFVACCVLDSRPLTLERGTEKVRQGWVRSSSIPVSSRYHIHVPVPGRHGEVHGLCESTSLDISPTNQESAGAMKPGCRVGN